MDRHVELIFNPGANRGQARQTIADLRGLFEEMDHVHWAPTEYPNHAAEIAARAAHDGYNVVVALGGDGTVHEVTNGLMRIEPEQRPALAVIPIGSGNDFAGGAKVLRPAPEAAKRVFEGQLRPIDVALAADEHGRREYWLNVCGIGFDAAVNLQSRTIPLVHGFLMYLGATLKTIALSYDAPHMKLAWDDGTLDMPIIMLTVGNGPREGGGFHTTPAATMDDGVLDFVLIEKVSRATMLRLIPEVMNGTHGRMPQIRLCRTTKLTLDADRALPVHLDGEVFAHYEANVRHVEIEVVPGAINLID
jgi:YegS/Rv2252/BmrU family lipid kinase